MLPSGILENGTEVSYEILET